MEDKFIYMDYNATTPVDPSVLESMLPWFTEDFGNAASPHSMGRRSLWAINEAREQVASLVGCRPGEVVFTSGATEANNTVLKGVIELSPSDRTRMIVGVTEHKAVLDAATWLADKGTKVDVVPCRRDGVIDPAAVDELLDHDVALVSVMLANNETGVINPVAEIADLAHSVGAVVHTDATQAVGRISVDVAELGVDLLSMSGHKVYGPKGVGALFARSGVSMDPLLHGGGHEGGRRSGTLNVPGVVGLGAAATIATQRLEEDSLRLEALTAHLEKRLTEEIPDCEPVDRDSAAGIRPPRLPNTLNIWFRGADADAVIANCPDLAISSGSACTSLVPSPSHVLTAMLEDRDAASECVRFSLGRGNDSADIEDAVEAVSKAVRHVRELLS